MYITRMPPARDQRIVWEHLNRFFFGRRQRGAYYSGIFYSADPPYYSKCNASIIRQSLLEGTYFFGLSSS